MAALSFEQPDVVPLFESRWDKFVAAWRAASRVQGEIGAAATPDVYYGVDIAIAAADETPWPSRAAEFAQRMIHAFKPAGTRTVMMHSDGNILSMLDGLVEAGLDGINPVEPKAGMGAGRITELVTDQGLDPIRP